MEKIYCYRFNEKTGLSCCEKFVKECKKYYKVAKSFCELKVVKNNFMSDYYILEKSDINKVLCSNFVYLTERDDKKALSLILENYEDKLNVSKENFEIHKNILETTINAIKKELEKNYVSN